MHRRFCILGDNLPITTLKFVILSHEVDLTLCNWSPPKKKIKKKYVMPIRSMTWGSYGGVTF
jgi:hypothetical protein